MEAGANRISLGIQAFNFSILSTFNRSPVAKYNTNVDFIIDFNEEEDFDFDKMMQFLERVRPRHLTMYSLEANEGRNLHKNASNPTFKKFYWEGSSSLQF